MNASIKPQHLMNSALGELLHSGYVYDEDLSLDFYGWFEDGEYTVEAVCAAGTSVNLTCLFSGRKLQYMGLWLDCKGVPSREDNQRLYGYEIARLAS